MTKDNPFGPQGWTPERIGDLTGKTIVITGANAGAGYEATRIFLARGANVLMLNRSAPKSEAAIAQLQRVFGPEANLRLIRMDLADLASVRDAAAQVLAEVPRIDVLIENAAIAQVAKQRLTKDGFESQLGTNHMGHFLLTRLLAGGPLRDRGEPETRRLLRAHQTRGNGRPGRGMHAGGKRSLPERRRPAVGAVRDPDRHQLVDPPIRHRRIGHVLNLASTWLVTELGCNLETEI